jgi:APA family basic amino acid/polyamine antiporter
LDGGITTRQLFTLSFGAIIGVGWIMVLGSWLADAGSIGAIVAFAAGAVLMLPVALCYAALAAAHPGAGGEMRYAIEIFGRAAGFAAAWVLILAYSTLVAFEAVSAGWIALVIFPGMSGRSLYQSLGMEVHAGELVTALLCATVIAYLNYIGSRAAAALQDVLTFLLIVVTTIFVVAGLVNGSFANLQPFWTAGGLSPDVYGIAAVLATTPFWYAGFNVLPQALAEKSHSVGSRSVRLAMLTSIAAAGIFYVAVILAGSAVLPRSELLEQSMPAAGAFQAAFASPVLGKLVLFAGFLGLVTTWNAVFFALTRLLQAVADQLSVLPWFKARHARFGTPARAVLGVFVVTSLLFGLGRGALLSAVSLVGVCFAMMFLLVSCAALRLKLREQSSTRRSRVVPVAAAVVSTGMLALSLHAGDGAGGLPIAWWVMLAWGVLGVLVWRHSQAKLAPQMQPTCSEAKK